MTPFLCSIPLRDGTVHMRLLFIVHRLFRLEMVYLRCWYDSKRLRRLFDPYLSWSCLPILGSVGWLIPRCYLWRAGSALLQQWNSSHHSVALKYLKPQHIHMSKDQSATFFVWNAAFSIMKYGYNEPWGRCPVAEFVDPFLRSCRGWPFFSATKKLKGRETGSAQILHVWCKFAK